MGFPVKQSGKGGKKRIEAINNADDWSPRYKKDGHVFSNDKDKAARYGFDLYIEPVTSTTLGLES